MNLDTSSWKPILLSELYRIYMGNKFDKNKMTFENPSINFVSRQSYNNGVDEKVDYMHGVSPYKKGLLTVALGGSYLGSCFVQKEDFYTAQNIAILEPRFDEMDLSVNLFISSLIRFESEIKYYAFGRELNKHIKTDFSIKLPVANGIPDWQTIKTITNSMHLIPITTAISKSPQLLDTKNWKKYKIGQIFSLENCKCSKAKDLLDGNDIWYIGAKKADNGRMEKVTYDEELVTSGNCIIFICDGEGSVGYANYMDKDFIGSTTLMAGYNDNLNQYVGMFLVTVLDLERPRYSFGRKWKTHLADTEIKLPATADGNPDYQFMEDYIKSFPYSDRI